MSEKRTIERQLVERDDTIDRLTREVANLRDFLSGLSADGFYLTAYDATREIQRQAVRGVFVTSAERDEVGDE